MACVSGVEQAKNIIISTAANVSISDIIKNVCMGSGPFNTSKGTVLLDLLLCSSITNHIIYCVYCFFLLSRNLECMACVSGVEQAKNIIISTAANVSISDIIKNVCMGSGPFNTSCGPFLHDLFLAVTLSFNKQFLVQRLCQI
ncbi:uncharacterized protein DC041_0001749 [Schistosoma bovis]|uniref:Uncharacterized protein n=1 Tax=Schistosoma bovis TaxID=6184 RepID=A0A430QHL8_SCHBO|nr:uncharacterized protein DC041_0001749 [Schistosoma bovis]